MLGKITISSSECFGKYCIRSIEIVTFRSENRGFRHGYMGHLINIANLIAHLCSVNSLGQFLSENLPEIYEQFQKFRDTTLQDINKTQESLLVNGLFVFTLKCQLYIVL